MQLFRLKYYKLLAFFIHLKPIHKHKALYNKALHTLQSITSTPITLIKPITPIQTTPFRTKKRLVPTGNEPYYIIYIGIYYPRNANKIPAATAEPITPDTLGPIACIKRKLEGFSC